MTHEQIYAALLMFILVREVFYHYSTNKLVNKLMSRNYFEYARAVITPVENKNESSEYPEPEEDFAAIG